MHREKNTVPKKRKNKKKNKNNTNIVQENSRTQTHRRIINIETTNSEPLKQTLNGNAVINLRMVEEKENRD